MTLSNVYVHTHTHTDSDESDPLQSGARRTTMNTKSSKQAAGGTRADSKLQHLEDTQPVGKKRAGKSSAVLTGTNTCNYNVHFLDMYKAVL